MRRGVFVASELHVGFFTTVKQSMRSKHFVDSGVFFIAITALVGFVCFCYYICVFGSPLASRLGIIHFRNAPGKHIVTV